MKAMVSIVPVVAAWLGVARAARGGHGQSHGRLAQEIPS